MAGNYAASPGHPDIFKMLQPLQEIPYLPDYLIRQPEWVMNTL